MAAEDAHSFDIASIGEFNEDDKRDFVEDDEEEEDDENDEVVDEDEDMFGEFCGFTALKAVLAISLYFKLLSTASNSSSFFICLRDSSTSIVFSSLSASSFSVSSVKYVF